MQKIARASQSRIVFGYITALQMLRMAQPCELASVRSGKPSIPERAPRTKELSSALERIEGDHPGLRFERPSHVLVSTPNGRAGELCVPHVCTRGFSRSSFFRLGDDVFFSKPELAFIQMATRIRNEVSLLELGWELCGSYQSRRTGVSVGYDVEPLTSVRALRDYVACNSSLGGAQKVARILPFLVDGSASSRETKFALVLGFSPFRGGYGMGFPRMNYEVIASPAARAISGKKSFRCDLCWPEARLDVEYQSKENHEGELSRIRDSRRANALAAMGWTVLGVTNDELNSLAATDAVAEAIRRHLGKRLRTNVSDWHARKLRLRRRLGLPVGYEEAI